MRKLFLNLNTIREKILKNQLVSNVMSLGAVTGLASVINFILGIVTRNMLGPEKYGYWLMISLIFTYGPFLQLGMLNAMNKEVPYFLAKKNMKRVDEIYNYTFSFLFFLSLFVSISLFVSSLLLSQSLKIETELIQGLMFASFLLLLLFLSMYCEMVYRSQQNFKFVAKLNFIKIVSQAIFTIIFVYSVGYIGLYIGMGLALLLEIFVAKKALRINLIFNLREVFKLIKIGFPMLVVGTAWSLMTGFDRILISIYLTPTDLGNYGVALLVFSSLMLIPGVITQITYPKFMQIIGSTESNYKSELRKYFLIINKNLSVIMLLVTLTLFVLIPHFIRLFLPEFTSGIKSAQILTLGIYPITLVGMAGNYFNAINKQLTYLCIIIFTIIFSFLLNSLLLLINSNILSIAIGTSISYFIYAILMNYFAWKDLNKLTDS